MEKTFETLQLKQRTAIELKYLDNENREISEKIDTPFDTVNNWFGENRGGNIVKEYNEYVKMMNDKRSKASIKQFIETDEHILGITTMIMRSVGKRINPSEEDLKEGVEKIELSVSDFKRAWEVQRVTLGKPTDVKRQDMSFDQKKLDEEAAQIREMLNGKDDEEVKEEKEEPKILTDENIEEKVDKGV